MMKKLVVLSGKGGTGKSSIASSIAYLLSRRFHIVCADCDVDTPNLYLLLDFKEESRKRLSTSEKASIDYSKCVDCERCVSVCPFGAIEKKEGKIVINENLCEGCGACVQFCGDAFSLHKADNAFAIKGMSSYGFPLVYGQLMMGNVGSGKIVSVIKEEAEKENADIMLIDSAAGIGCSVIASCKDADFALVVSEPTTSSFSDMKRAFELLDHFGIPRAVVINKHTMNPAMTAKIEEYCSKKSADVVAKIPFDKLFVESLVNLKPIVLCTHKYDELFQSIANFVCSKLFDEKKQYEDGNIAYDY